MENRILLIGAIRGLVSEGARVVEIAEKFEPGILAMSISREGLEAMKAVDGTKSKDAGPANPEEEMYITGLSDYGEVVKPPPCFSDGMRYAIRQNIPIETLDMDDEHYTAAYCKYVSTLDMIRQGSSGKRYARHLFSSETPLEFVMEWDGLVNSLRGYRDLENAREDWLAKGLHRLSKQHGNVLAVIEIERLDGVERQLRALGCDFESVQP